MVKGQHAFVHDSVKNYGYNIVGDFSIVLENVILGYPTSDILEKLRDCTDKKMETLSYNGCRIGHHTILRSNVVVYKDTSIGNYVRTGHNVLIREECTVGDYVLLGTNVVIDRSVVIGSHVSIQSSVYIPTSTIIEDYVFLGPNCVLLNDRYPIRIGNASLEAPILRKGVTIGGNATILPGIEVGEGSLVTASAVVTRNVPPWHMAVGSPARSFSLKEELKVYNRID
ncbi:MAG: N-acetyltransferase [Nitrospirae bacterium]|nr:N-acetyltransferase [Nitrospirota bacterium]